jgi:hypothetical protein
MELVTAWEREVRFLLLTAKSSCCLRLTANVVQGRVILADFEGENIGWGGELVTAQFLPTQALDKSLSPTRFLEPPPESEMGLLIDADREKSREIVRAVMESRQLTKIIWGADGDLATLRHQLYDSNLNRVVPIRSINVIDVQLGFSTMSRRLGMKTMMERVPRSFTLGLSSKDLPGNFYEPSTRNQVTSTIR